MRIKTDTQKFMEKVFINVSRDTKIQSTKKD